MIDFSIADLIGGEPVSVGDIYREPPESERAREHVMSNPTALRFHTFRPEPYRVLVREGILTEGAEGDQGFVFQITPEWDVRRARLAYGIAEPEKD